MGHEVTREFRMNQLRGREIAGVRFEGTTGFVECQINSKSATADCPFCGQTARVFEESGVGGFVENQQVLCPCGFSQSPYDGGLALPEQWASTHLGQ